MAFTPEMLAKLEAQRAYFASDDYIREKVAPWRDSTPGERLAELADMCAAGAYFLARLEPDVLARVTRPEQLPDDTIELLTRLRTRR